MAQIKFVTVTWRGDLEHFSILRESYANSRLAGHLHEIIVQHEDLELFSNYRESGVELYSTRDILAPEVEQHRVTACKWKQLLGRRIEVLGGSLSRCCGVPNWLRYTGWHTQQLCKLARVATSEVDTVVLLDSDLVITGQASSADFMDQSGAVCFENVLGGETSAGKSKKWRKTASELLKCPNNYRGDHDSYFDTPFVMHAPAVREMLDWLEGHYERPWWQTLIALPPRRWSEFGIYKGYLRHHYSGEVSWKEANKVGYVFDASDSSKLIAQFRQLLEEQRCHYITIHSQSSGRNLWGARHYKQGVLELLGGSSASDLAQRANSLASKSAGRDP